MSTPPFTDAELEYLIAEERLARMATVGPDGTPHVVPLGWQLGPDRATIHIGGHDLERTKKYRDVARTGRAALVIDDVVPPFRPRGVEVRGRAEVRSNPEPVIVIYPERIVSWGIHSDRIGERYVRSVS